MGPDVEMSGSDESFDGNFKDKLANKADIKLSDSEESDDCNFRDQLSSKAERVRNWYQNQFLLENASSSSTECSENQKKIYASMKRWHKNSHIGEEIWLKSYNAILSKLDLEKNMKVDSTLKKFIMEKKRNTALVQRLKSSEMFEFLIPTIKSLYDKLIDDSEEEFSDKILKMSGPEMYFYIDYFEPSAVFYAYREVHSDTPAKDLLNDLFTIGIIIYII